MVFNRKIDARPIEAASVEVKAQPMGIQASAQNVSAFPTPSAAAAVPASAHSIIGTNLSIEGQAITIRCAGSLVVNGSIHADIHASALVVGEEGTVSGAIAADQVDVHGRVQGSIHGASVVLHGTAQVEGDIQSAYLTIERGATFDGSSRRVSESAVLKPEVTSRSAQRFGKAERLQTEEIPKPANGAAAPLIAPPSNALYG